MQQAVDDEVAIAEFRTMMEAAEVLHEAGIRALRRAPNLVRVRSSNGAVTVQCLARELRVA